MIIFSTLAVYRGLFIVSSEALDLRREKMKRRQNVRRASDAPSLLRDLQSMRKVLKQVGIAKRRQPHRISKRFGQNSIQETLEDAHFHIDRAIRRAKNGDLILGAYLLGVLSATANAVNDPNLPEIALG